MKGSGGTEGGVGKFAIGFCLALLAVWLFFDSVRVTTAGSGFVSGLLIGGAGRGHWWETTSMGIIFVPFLLGVIVLFYDAEKKWGWWLMYAGIAVIAIEILSRIQFFMNAKTTHLLGMFVLFGAGAGLMLRSYRDESKTPDKDAPKQ